MSMLISDTNILLKTWLKIFELGPGNALPVNANRDVKLYVYIQGTDNVRPFFELIKNLR